MEEFVFAAILGVMASAPVACASWSVLAEQSLRVRLLITIPPALALIGIVYAAMSHAMEAVFGYVLLPLLSIVGFSGLRRLRGWRFQRRGGSSEGNKVALRYSLGTLLWCLIGTSVYACLVALLDSRRNDSLEFLIAFVVLFFCGVVALHWLSAWQFGRGLAVVFRVGVLCSFLVAAKFAVSDNFPGGPMFRFNKDFLGPVTIGFTLGALGVQAIYLMIVRATGWRLTIGATPPEAEPTA